MSDNRPLKAFLATEWGVRAVGMGVVVLLIAILTVALPFNSAPAALLLDRQEFSIFPYPFTIQNLIYLILGWSLSELFMRWRSARREQAFLKAGLLPEDDATILQIKELGPIRQRVAAMHDDDGGGFLPYLMDLTILQLQASRSVDQAMNVLTNSLSLMGDRVDLRYQMLRYMAWLIPTIGFIGTVIGISLALELMDADAIVLSRVVGGLSVSFYTTLIALLSSAVLAFAQHRVQEMEEGALNAAGTYCLRHLINRVYVEPGSTR